MTPTSTSANTDVSVPTGCGLLDYSVDLHSLAPIDAPTTGPWEADWGHGGQDMSAGIEQFRASQDYNIA